MLPRATPLLLALFALLVQPLPPAAAQDGGGEPELEIGEPGEGDNTPPSRGEEWEKDRNRGGKGKRDDVDAPALERVTQKNVNKAIEEGVRWLKKNQKRDGSWGPVRADRMYGEKQKTGDYVRDELAPTAFSIYALSKCDVSRRDRSVRRGLKYLAKELEFVFDVQGGKGEMKGQPQNPSRSTPRVLTTYESAAIVLMLEAVYHRSEKLTGRHRKRGYTTDNPRERPRRSRMPEELWTELHERILHLTKGRTLSSGGGRRGGRRSTTRIPGLQVTQGRNAGGWRYSPGNDADLSATQFVLLALRAASQAGYPVEKTAPDVWRNAASYVMNCQARDGGFSYQIGQPKSTGSMTACGVASLIICKEQMELVGQPVPAQIDERVKRGLEWLDKNFHPHRNPNGAHNYYYMYGVERVGDLTGRKEFGGRDWYVRGAAHLLQTQEDDGKWVDQTAFPPRDVLGTCYAILFLKRATPPTVTIGTDDR